MDGQGGLVAWTCPICKLSGYFSQASIDTHVAAHQHEAAIQGGVGGGQAGGGGAAAGQNGAGGGHGGA